MFAEHGAIELIFLAAVALIVVGPKDLPILMRKVGQFTSKMRGLAAEFRASFEELARQSELDELRKEVEALRKGQLGMAEHQTEIEREFDELHHALHPPPGEAAYTPLLSVERAEPEPAPEPEEQPDLPFQASAVPPAADPLPAQPTRFDPPAPVERRPEGVRA